MVLLQPKLHLRLSQRQILTPGLVQMVSVLALNKLELRDMITAEMVENPVLEELEDTVPLLDDAARQEEDRERLAPEANPRQLALALLAALEGGLLLAQVQRDPEPLAAALDAMLMLIGTLSRTTSTSLDR